jgi:hypothetical protein
MVMGRVGKACCAVLPVAVAANTASSEAKVLPRSLAPGLGKSPAEGLAKGLAKGPAKSLAKSLLLSCMSLSLEMAAAR